MKIQLDYDSKVITILENVNLKKFTDNISKLLPDWESWSLNVTNSIVYYAPITIPYVPPTPRPWWELVHTGTPNPIVTYTDDAVTGVYTLDIS